MAKRKITQPLPHETSAFTQNAITNPLFSMSNTGVNNTNLSGIAIAPKVTSTIKNPFVGRDAGAATIPLYGGTPTPAPVVAQAPKPTISTKTTTPVRSGSAVSAPIYTAPQAPVIKAPDDPSNMYNTATGALNPKYTNYQAPTPPPGSAGYIYQQSAADKANDTQYNAIGDYYQNEFNQSIDPNKIYQDTLKRYQSQIDAINNMFNDQLNNSRIQNAPTYKAREDQNRIGQVMGGLVQSPMGQAQTNQIQDANSQEQASAEAIINDKRASAIASVYGQARQSSEAELQAKRLAKSKGADELLKYLNAAPERKAKQISTVAKSLLAQGIDIKDLSPEELENVLKELGTDKDTFTVGYEKAVAEQKTAEQEAAKEEAELSKVKAEVENLEGKYDFEAAQKALDRALEEKKFKSSNAIAWYNATTSRLGENRQAAKDKDEKDQKNYDGTTIPTTVKSELIFDLQQNMTAKKKDRKSLQDFFETYPEVNTKYLSELYEVNI